MIIRNAVLNKFDIQGDMESQCRQVRILKNRSDNFKIMFRKDPPQILDDALRK
jgi:hypothetical protein